MPFHIHICVWQRKIPSACRDGLDPGKLPIRDRVTDHSRALGVWAGFTGRGATGWGLVFEARHGGENEKKARDDDGNAHKHGDELGEWTEGGVVKSLEDAPANVAWTDIVFFLLDVVLILIVVGFWVLDYVGDGGRGAGGDME